MGFQKGHKGFVTIRKGHPAWNKGLTKKTDERVRKYAENLSKSILGKPNPKLSETLRKLYAEGARKPPFLNKHHTDASRDKISKKNLGRKNPHLSELNKRIDIRKKHSEIMKKMYENNPELKKILTKKANEKTRELVKEGKQVLQLIRFDNRIVKPTKPQTILYNYVKNIFPEALIEYKIYEIRKSCDIAIPSLKIDIEYDEPYWHKDKESDNKRDEAFLSIGWKVIRFNPEILKVIK